MVTLRERYSINPKLHVEYYVCHLGNQRSRRIESASRLTVFRLEILETTKHFYTIIISKPRKYIDCYIRISYGNANCHNIIELSPSRTYSYNIILYCFKHFWHDPLDLWPYKCTIIIIIARVTCCSPPPSIIFVLFVDPTRKYRDDSRRCPSVRLLFVFNNRMFEREM